MTTLLDALKSFGGSNHTFLASSIKYRAHYVIFGSDDISYCQSVRELELFARKTLINTDSDTKWKEIYRGDHGRKNSNETTDSWQHIIKEGTKTVRLLSYKKDMGSRREYGSRKAKKSISIWKLCNLKLFGDLENDHGFKNGILLTVEVHVRTPKRKRARK